MKNVGKVTLLAVAILGVSAASAMQAGAATQSTQNVERLYNPNSGEHLYTSSSYEVKADVNAGWKDEGLAFVAATQGSPVYRVYNKNSGEHFYTTNADEMKSLVKAGWQDEGVAYHSSAPTDGKPLYRVYNRNSGLHFYTSSTAERDSLVNLGWGYEGIAWYTVKTPAAQVPDGQPIHIYFARHGQTMLNVMGRIQGWTDSPLTANGILVAEQTGKGIGVGVKDDPVHPALHFDAAYSSDVTRTENTARILLDNAGQKNLSVTPTSDFREVNSGDFEGMSFAEGNKPVYVLAGYNYDKDGNPSEGGGYNADGINYQDQLFGNAGLNLKPHLNWLHQADVNIYGQNPNNPALSTNGNYLAEDYQTVVNRMEAGTSDVVKDAEKKNEHNVLVVSSGMSLEILLTNLDPSCGPKYFNGKSLANASISEVTYTPKTNSYVVDYASDTTYSKLGAQLDSGK